MRCVEVSTGREVEVVSGDARLPTVTYRYTDDDSIRIVTREDFYLNGYYVSCKGTPMHRSMIFTVQRSTKDGRFYVNLDHGNGKIVLTEPRGRASKSSAFNLCDSIWQGFGYSIDPTHKLQWPPVPYGPHSLKPRLIS